MHFLPASEIRAQKTFFTRGIDFLVQNYSTQSSVQINYRGTTAVENLTKLAE